MKDTTINIRVSGDKKKEIEQDAKKLGNTLGIKIGVSAFMLWLHSNWKKGE